jgi:hypothetical protein
MTSFYCGEGTLKVLLCDAGSTLGNLVAAESVDRIVFSASKCS